MKIYSLGKAAVNRSLLRRVAFPVPRPDNPSGGVVLLKCFKDKSFQASNILKKETNELRHSNKLPLKIGKAIIKLYILSFSGNKYYGLLPQVFLAYLH